MHQPEKQISVNGEWVALMVVLLLFTIPPKFVQLVVARLLFGCKTYPVEDDGQMTTMPLMASGKQAKLAGDPVLEVAGGTGRITLPIARAGIEISGLDISRPMLERARRKAEVERLGITWLERDGRLINMDQASVLIG